MDKPIEPAAEPSEAQTGIADEIEYQDPRMICSHQLDATSTRRAHRCGSPALRGQAFCYYHHPICKPIPSYRSHRRALRARRTSRQPFSLASSPTHHELQYALEELLDRLAANRIDTYCATLILSALQIADPDHPPDPPRILPEGQPRIHL